MVLDRRKGVGVLRNAAGGFSLIELMVVLVILAVGLLPLAFVQARSARNVVESGSYTQAVQLAQLQLESAKSLGFGNVQAGTATVGNYTWTSTVQNVSFGLDQVSVRVTWDEKGVTRTVTVVDMLSMR